LKGVMRVLSSKWAFILVGDDLTGKTIFQKYVIKHLCGFEEWRTVDENHKLKRLDVNKVFPIVHPDAPRKLETAFFMNRSFQEKQDEYQTVENFFDNEHFKDADVCFLSSHLDANVIGELIEQCHKRIYNVCGVFWSNCYGDSTQANQSIALLNWNEKFWLFNEKIEPFDETKFNFQLEKLAINFVQMFVSRAAMC